MGRKGKAKLGTPWLWDAYGQWSFEATQDGVTYGVKQDKRGRCTAYCDGEPFGRYRSLRSAARACVGKHRGPAGTTGLVLLIVGASAFVAYTQNWI